MIRLSVLIRRTVLIRLRVLIRFAANVSLLFTELPFLERFAAAAAAGFDTVEFHWPRGEDLGAVATALHEAEIGRAHV